MYYRTFRNRLIDFLKGFRKVLALISRAVLFYLGVLGFTVVIYEVGFLNRVGTKDFFHVFYSIVLLVYSLFLGIRIQTRKLKRFRISVYLIETLAFLILLAYSINNLAPDNWLLSDIHFLKVIGNKTFIHFLVSMIFVIELSKNTVNFYRLNVNPALLFLLSFVFLIFTGTGLLLLPNSTTGGISFIDALFTSASAVCVTGLTAVDTALKFTFMGKMIIIMLIQTGGLGIMTFTSLFGLFFSGNLTFQNQLFLKDYISHDNIGEVFKVLFKIAFFTFMIELTGAFFIFLTVESPLLVTTGDKIFFSVFHSISAFCNAGFSTFSNNLYDPSIRYNYGLQLIISFLIVMGGIGFPIMLNYYKLLKIKIKNFLYRLVSVKKVEYIPRIININTKIVVRTTLILLLIGTVCFFILEFNNTLSDHSFWGKIVVSFFNSVTPRTAGFNNINMAILLRPTVIIIILLMWIGASPASTGGGIKTSTFAIALLNIFSLARGKNRTEFMRREIPAESIKRSFAIIILSIVLTGSAIFFLGIFETDKSLLSLAFETFSAFGTVGLSLGITPALHDISKLIIIVVMFLGRVGSLTLMVGLLRKVTTINYHYPTENIFIN